MAIDKQNSLDLPLKDTPTRCTGFSGGFIRTNMKTEWIYIFGEPKRHKDIYEIGQTTKTVEQRNRDKRSIDTWIEMARYPVADSRRAEADLIRATKNYRYNKRKEILQIDWQELKKIADHVASRHTSLKYELDVRHQQLSTKYVPIRADIQKNYRDEVSKVKDKIHDKFAREVSREGVGYEHSKAHETVMNGVAGVGAVGFIAGMIFPPALLLTGAAAASFWAEGKMDEPRSKRHREIWNKYFDGPAANIKKDAPGYDMVLAVDEKYRKKFEELDQQYEREWASIEEEVIIKQLNGVAE